MSTAALQVSLQQKQTVVLACIKTRRKCGFLANKLYFLLSRKSAHNWLLISTGSGYLFLCGFTTADAQNLWCLYVCVSATKDITALLVFPSTISDIQLSVENTAWEFSMRIQHKSSILLQSASITPADITKGSASANSANSTDLHSHHASKVINLMQ